MIRRVFLNRTVTFNNKYELHSFNGNPAIEYVNGTKLWYRLDKLHREDGPAIITKNGDKWWYINGRKLTEKQFNNYFNFIGNF